MLIRYPGSKDKHLSFLSAPLHAMLAGDRRLCEPFAGTASVTFHALATKLVDTYHINDLDVEMISLWKTVRNNHRSLIQRIADYTPNIEDFFAYKEAAPVEDVEEAAWRKLVLHQVSYSGLGRKAGGPLGGKSQAGKYRVDARWSPQRLTQNIEKCHDLLLSVPGDFTALTWEECLAMVDKKMPLYLDPPYVVKGGELYEHGSIDHALLAEELSQRKRWMLSYDDAPQIHEWYSPFAYIEKIPVTSHLHHATISDVLVCPRNLVEAAASQQVA